MKKIVLVEDDEAITDAFFLVSETMDWEVVSYTNGQEIFESRIEPPGLFILDKNLPGIDGLDLCRFIKSHEHYKNVPVVIISASTNLAQTAPEAGADGWVTKPFKLAALKEEIGKYIS